MSRWKFKLLWRACHAKRDYHRWLKRCELAKKQRQCAHVFRSADLHLTGIPEPAQPKRLAPKADWDRWGSEVICGNHPWHTERVTWKCAKCGREFRAHCGLDVLQHGTPIPNDAPIPA